MKKIFAIFDKKALVYLSPMCFHNKGLALRFFGEICNDSKTDMYKYPADFSIWIIGDWDERTGHINPLSKPEFLDEAANIVNKEPVKNGN